MSKIKKGKTKFWRNHSFYYSKRKQYPYRISLLFLFFGLFFQITLYSESYSEHRMDDQNYLFGGRKSIANTGRINSIKSEEKSLRKDEKNNSQDLIETKQYLTSKFYSQKGGDKEDLTGRYATKSIYSPELSSIWNFKKSKSMLLFSPNFIYKENYILKKNINRIIDFELIASIHWENRNYSLSLETGRGFQRLDAYGLIFNGFANYWENVFHWKPLNAKLLLHALSYNYNQDAFTTYSNLKNDNLLGGSLFFQSIPYLEHLSIFNYHILEPGQIAIKQTLQEDKEFKAKGNFHYRGFELRTKRFLEISDLELGLISIIGTRDYAEYAYQQFNNISNTNGLLSYFVSNFNFNNSILRIGGLYASKDRSTSLNRAQNGYSALLSDTRIFGGKSSFLLMETVNRKNGTLFREFDSTRENQYDTKGMELASIGLSFNLTKRIQINGIINHANSNLGIGNEGILSLLYNFTKSDSYYSGFLLFSGCVARVNPVTQKKILFDEFRIDPDLKEFTRFYASGGIQF